MPNNKRPPGEVAAEILEEKYSSARCAFVGGSFNRGEETAYSDIDLVVIFEQLDHGWRESFTFDGWPVEAFVHDPETLAFYMQSDIEGGMPSLATMILEGPLIPAAHPFGADLKARAKTLLEAGPPAWDQETIDRKRYMITNLIDDLRDPRSAIESAAIIGALHESLADFYFRTRRVWSGSFKHIPRILAKADPELAARWTETFLAAWAGNAPRLISFAEEILLQSGGLLFNGYRSDAPQENRLENL